MLFKLMNYEWRTVRHAVNVSIWLCFSPILNRWPMPAHLGPASQSFPASTSRHLNIMEAEKLFKLDGGSFEAHRWSLAGVPGDSLSNPLMSLLPRNILGSHWESLQSLTWKLILECHWLHLVSRLLRIMIAASVEPCSACSLLQIWGGDIFAFQINKCWMLDKCIEVSRGWFQLIPINISPTAIFLCFASSIQ